MVQDGAERPALQEAPNVGPGGHGHLGPGQLGDGDPLEQGGLVWVTSSM